MHNSDNHRYIPITQQPFCCVPACIQMILIRRELPLLSQEEIGAELGLTVPAEVLKKLPNARSGQMPIHGWGTRVQEPKYSLNSFFSKQGLPLKETYHAPATITSLTDFLQSRLKLDADLIACFRFGKLYGTDYNGGHCSLVDRLESSSVILVDPEYEAPKFRPVSADLLQQAMALHGEECYGGIWEISST